MTKEDLQSIATAADLKEVERRITDELDELKDLVIRLTQRKEGPPKIFYSPKEFACSIGVSKGTVTRWCNDGTIQATQQGGKGTIWLIPHTELKRLLRESQLIVPQAS